MSSIGRVIQGLIILSALLGILFLVQVYGVLPQNAFVFVFVGWVMYVIDSVMTFVRPTVSFYFGFVLAAITLSSSLPQSAHYSFIMSGQLLPSTTFLLGTLAQLLILVLVPYYALKGRRRV